MEEFFFYLLVTMVKNQEPAGNNKPALITPAANIKALSSRENKMNNITFKWDDMNSDRCFK